MTLREKQCEFTRMVSNLITYATDEGYELTFGDAFRSPEECVRQGKANSVHGLRLAVDFNLFKDGVYLTSTEDHTFLGEFWESMGGAWGGRFKDGNHYSLEHNGVK